MVKKIKNHLKSDKNCKTFLEFYKVTSFSMPSNGKVNKIFFIKLQNFLLKY